jgi:hypothetical protein
MFHMMRKTSDGRWVYIESYCSMDFACKNARYCQDFYLQHGILIGHMIGVDRGQTVEFLPVPLD